MDQIPNLGVEATFLRNVILPLSGWEHGELIYELGAGEGHHAELLRRMGYRIAAIEADPEACARASRMYQYLMVKNADPVTWCPPLYRGHIFARGADWWHYELSGVNEQGIDVDDATARIFNHWMADGDRLTLQVVTDFSGGRGPGGVHMNRLVDYQNLFGQYGLTRVYGWDGQPADQYRPGRGVIVVTEKG